MRPPWNFGESRRIALSLDEFLAQQETTGVKFFDGKEPWIEGINNSIGKHSSESARRRWITFL